MANSTLKSIDIAAYALLLIGALNWGLIGLFSFDLVGFLFGELTILSRIVYCLVGLAAIYDLVAVKSIWKRWDVHFHEPAQA